MIELFITETMFGQMYSHYYEDEDDKDEEEAQEQAEGEEVTGKSLKRFWEKVRFYSRIIYLGYLTNHYSCRLFICIL